MEKWVQNPQSKQINGISTESIGICSSLCFADCDYCLVHVYK